MLIQSDSGSHYPAHVSVGSSLPAGSARTVSDAEKYCYALRGHLPMVLFGTVSAVLLLIGLSRFAVLEAVFFVAVPFWLMNGTYLLLSFGIMLLPGRFQLDQHRQLVDDWSRVDPLLAGIYVDVYLPVCGEPLEVVLESWQGVQELRWPGALQVWVLDDSPTDVLRQAAAQHGFGYLRREGRDLCKSGNLRHAFTQTSGEFMLLLDADFRPRPEMLLELIPYLLTDARTAIVQSPQFFEVHPRMNWIQAGAGFVQELFYRVVQPARDRLGAAVCVGACAVYRRSALAEIGGMAPISHSEDLWTGCELMDRGWRIRYVPVILAKGLCPDRLDSYFQQQVRWCRGSLSLIGSRRFWQSRLTPAQKLCFFSGFFYYLTTAWNVWLSLLPPLVMVCLFPGWVHFSHLAYSILALIYTPLILCWWSVYPFGIHFLTAREVSGAAHLHALAETLLGNGGEWSVTGRRPARSGAVKVPSALQCLLAISTLGTALIWIFAAIAIARQPARWGHFVPPMFFSTMYLMVCWRSLAGLPATFSWLWSRWFAPVSEEQHWTWGRLASGLGMLLFVCTLSAAAWGISSTSRDGFKSPEMGQLQNSRTGAPLFNTHPHASFAEYTVEDPFPELELRRVIRMREHPEEPGVFYFADFTGRIEEVRRIEGQRIRRTVADLTRQNCRFLYSFVLHPRFSADRRLFVAYRTESGGGQMLLRVSEVRAEGPDSATSGHEQILIEQQIETDEHVGGDLAFDDSGCLLVSCGDNERSLHDKRSQKLDDGFASGILRLDVDQRGDDFSHVPKRVPRQTSIQHYRIPHDNPFVGTPKALEEFWALGLRNPFRMSFDSVRKQLWIGDVGQDRLEQIEVAVSGSNHQWSFQEGSIPFTKSHLQGKPPAVLLGTSTSPFFEYPHEDLNACIIGGEIYRGDRFPELSGQYLFGDNRSGRVWSIDPDDPHAKSQLLQLPFGKAASTLVSISTDRSGEIYFTNFVSVPSVYRLKRSEPMLFPERLSEAGLFSNVELLTPTTGVIPYDVNVPLWSDGLQKRRWFRLPGAAKIDTSMTPWKFPAGTLFIKHFEQGAEFAQPGQPVETRLLVMRDDGTTAGASYLWNSEGTDAILQTSRVDLPLTADGSPFSYRIPAADDCKVCHHRERPVLGISAEQLQCEVTIVGRTWNQLEWLQSCGAIERAAEFGSTRPVLASFDHPFASLETRARSYLHANCSFCHHKDGLEHVQLNLDYFAADWRAHLIRQRAKLGYHQIDGRYAQELIAPGKLYESAIYLRMQTQVPHYSMPYLGRTRPHKEALQVIADWILSESPEAQR